MVLTYRLRLMTGREISQIARIWHDHEKPNNLLSLHAEFTDCVSYGMDCIIVSGFQGPHENARDFEERVRDVAQATANQIGCECPYILFQTATLVLL